jgi:hypothetical protein
MSNVTFLDPANIFAEIEAHPPLMRAEAANTYVGKDIDWLLTFFSGHELGIGRARLTFRIASQGIGMVVGAVSLSDYPWLKSLHADEPVRVRGRIRKIDTMSIELEISELLLDR